MPQLENHKSKFSTSRFALVRSLNFLLFDVTIIARYEWNREFKRYRRPQRARQIHIRMYTFCTRFRTRNNEYANKLKCQHSKSFT